ncbi:hypothetical protein TNCV_12741 [Trichonephila clavipes]|nr:hypothetical protein TNCV_12741 [Trichonephila clavipes]
MLDLILSGFAKPSLYVYTDHAKVLIWTDEMVWTVGKRPHPDWTLVSSDNLHADSIASDNIQLDNMQSSSDNVASDSLHGTSDNMASDTMNVTLDNMASDTMNVTSDNMASDTMTSDNMAQIEDETNLYKKKLIWVGRNMPSNIRLVPPVRIDMAKKKFIWVKRKLQMIKNK